MEDDRSKINFRWAAILARWLLGLLFFMAGWMKVFEMGAVEHARQLFVEGYKDSWIPFWLLWFFGFTIPFVELISGGLLLIGFRIREALITLVMVLVIVTYGHLLENPFYDVTTHILPRALLVVFLFMIPQNSEPWTIDTWLSKRKFQQ